MLAANAALLGPRAKLAGDDIIKRAAFYLPLLFMISAARHLDTLPDIIVTFTLFTSLVRTLLCVHHTIVLPWIQRRHFPFQLAVIRGPV